MSEYPADDDGFYTCPRCRKKDSPCDVRKLSHHTVRVAKTDHYELLLMRCCGCGLEWKLTERSSR